MRDARGIGMVRIKDNEIIFVFLFFNKFRNSKDVAIIP